MSQSHFNLFCAIKFTKKLRPNHASYCSWNLQCTHTQCTCTCTYNFQLKPAHRVGLVSLLAWPPSCRCQGDKSESLVRCVGHCLLLPPQPVYHQPSGWQCDQQQQNHQAMEGDGRLTLTHINAPCFFILIHSLTYTHTPHSHTHTLCTLTHTHLHIHTQCVQTHIHSQTSHQHTLREMGGSSTHVHTQCKCTRNCRKRETFQDVYSSQTPTLTADWSCLHCSSCPLYNQSSLLVISLEVNPPNTSSCDPLEFCWHCII